MDHVAVTAEVLTLATVGGYCYITEKLTLIVRTDVLRLATAGGYQWITENITFIVTSEVLPLDNRKIQCLR